jgi:hypothetical protein
MDGKQQREIRMDLQHRMGYHPATEKTGPLHDKARRILIKAAMDLAKLDGVTGRERAVMFTHLEEALMWANKGIACNNEPE